MYSHLELLARQAVAGFITGLHKSPFHGFSVEFAEHRQYNQGESIKHIDWKLFGRTDKLFVKRFEEETNLRCQIVLDNSSSMYFPFDESKPFVSKSKTNYGLFAASVIIYLLKLQRDAFGLTVFSDDIEFHTGARSTTQHHQFLMNTLDNIEVDITVELGATTMPIHHMLRMGRGAVIELDATEHDPLRIYANSTLVAKGEVNVEEGHLRVFVTEKVLRFG